MLYANSVFLTNCQSCHGPDGSGLVGPNLTDDYYRNVKKITDIAEVIKNGAAGGSMPAWKTRLHPNEVVLMAAYVARLRGKNLTGRRAPEGEKIRSLAERCGRSQPPSSGSESGTREREREFQSAGTRWPRSLDVDGRWFATLASSAACRGALSAGKADAGLCLDRRFHAPAVSEDPWQAGGAAGLAAARVHDLRFHLPLDRYPAPGPGADHADRGHLPGDGPGRPRVVRLDVSADGLHGVCFPADGTAFRRPAWGPASPGEKADDAAHGGEICRLPGCVRLSGPHLPGLLRRRRGLGPMGPPFAVGASGIVPRDACRDRADAVRLRLFPRADVHRRLSLRAVPVGDARSRLAHRQLRSASRRTPRQAGRSQRPMRAVAWRLHRLRHRAPTPAPRASTSAKACNWSASPARNASTPATA